jgi:hypothetical protein
MKAKILIISNNNYSFVNNDKKLLEQKYYVNVFVFNFKKTTHHFKIIKLIKEYDIIICRLAHYYSYFVALYNRIFYNKPLITVIGGDEVENMPEYQYGALANKKRKFCVNYTLKMSNFILPVNENLKEKIITVYGVKNKIEVVHTSADFEFWHAGNTKNNTILTVGNIDSKKRFYIKGIDRFFLVAKNMPSYDFIIAGLSIDLDVSVPNNVKIYRKANNKDLYALYNQSKVYCQFSRSEGTPNTVCEAMLCECIPVCTDVGGMNFLCSESGYLIKTFNVASAILFIEKALNDKSGQYARKFIINNFNKKTREKKIDQILKSLLKNS